jgi:hypothetical protein
MLLDSEYLCLCPSEGSRWLWNFNVLNWCVKLNIFFIICHYLGIKPSRILLQSVLDRPAVRRNYMYPPPAPPLLPKNMACDWTFAIILSWSPHEYYTEIAHLYSQVRVFVVLWC